MAGVEAESEVLGMEQGVDDVRTRGTPGALEFWGPEARPLNIALSCAKSRCAHNKCPGDMLRRTPKPPVGLKR